MSLDSVAWSEHLVSLVSRAGESVVRVEGRRRAGSGVVWSPEAVVAAAHSVDDEDELEIGLPDGETVRGEVAGRDPATDLAAVRLARPLALPAPAWRDEPPSAGELSVTVTRPGRAARAALGLVARVSPGEWRGPGGARLDRFVELDVALRPGLSGGIAVDLAGRALGLATAGVVRGLALAVPPATLRRVMGALLAHGGIRRGYLGVATVPVRLPATARAAAGVEHALLVSGLDDDGPAARAGLLVGDLLLACDAAPLAHPRDLAPALEEERIGSAAALRILRAGAARDLSIVVGARGGRP